MEKSAKFSFIIIIMYFAFNSTSYAQDFKEGSIKYERHIYYDYNVTPAGGQAGNNSNANLPTAKTMGMILYFDTKHSLYEQDMSVEVAGVSESQQVMLVRLSNREAPKPEIKKVYSDLKKEMKTVIIEMMTRFFTVEDKLVNQSWKLGTEQRKIIGYLCNDATMKLGEQTITGWFTSKIPVSVGPEEYSGLPGIILALEINGRNVFLATSVDPAPPKPKSIVKPDDGSKISQKEFDEMLAQKTAEWAERMKNRPAGGR